jgi:Membrane proteins related to metalloendopeptidases
MFGISALVMAFGLKTSTSVLYDGRLVGVVESKDVAVEAVAKAETQANGILGQNCLIGNRISYRKGIAATNLSPDDLTKEILSEVDGIESLYTLSVNGEVIGGTENRKDIEDLLVSILETNMSSTAMSAKFSEKTKIDQGFVAKGSVHDLAEMKAELTEKKADGTSLLNVETVEEFEYTSPVTYTTEYIQDDTMYEGQYTQLSEGTNGKAIVKEQQTIRDGTKISSEIKNTTILINPTPAVVAVGTMPRTKSKGYYIWPLTGLITSKYGYRNIGMGSAFHSGLDIGVSYGTPIHAADGGTVIFSGWYSDYGNLIEIQHDNGDVTRYAHNSENLVSAGDKVAQGDVIAKAGATGLADGIHLHFEVVKNGGTRVDPLSVLP